MEIKLENSEGLVLWVGAGDTVQVPMDPNERAQCRKALLDALDLLDQTIVKQCTFSTATGPDQFETQSLPHLSDCLGVYDFSPPTAQRESNPKPKLRLVSAGPLLSDC